MKTKVNWNEKNWCGYTTLNMTKEQRAKLDTLLHDRNKKDPEIMVVKCESGNIYFASSGGNGNISYNIDQGHPIAYLFKIFDFGKKEVQNEN